MGMLKKTSVWSLSCVLLFGIGKASLPSCVKERASTLPGNEFLQTSNTASYLCTVEQLETYYDPKNITCGQSQEDTSDISVFECPVANTNILCILTIGWGSVAGDCDTCYDSCSINSGEGIDSCCGIACEESDGSVGDDDCGDTSWIPNQFTDECGSNSTGGYCDCCPNCGVCLFFYMFYIPGNINSSIWCVYM